MIRDHQAKEKKWWSTTDWISRWTKEIMIRDHEAT